MLRFKVTYTDGEKVFEKPVCANSMEQAADIVLACAKNYLIQSLEEAN